MTDMLCMACVCEGTMHSEEISKQYLKTIKTAKQVDPINRTRSASKDRGCGRTVAKTDTDHSQKVDLQGQATVPIVAVANCLNDVKPLAKNAITVIKKAIFHSTLDPSNIDIHLPNPDTTIIPGSPIMMSMT